MRRALLLCLVGSGLALLSASRTWTSRVIDHGSALPLEHINKSGLDLEPGLRPLALVGLVSVVALVALRKWGRAAVALIASGCGAVIMGASLQHSPGVWPLLSALGGAMLVEGGAWTLARGHRWGGLSDAYRTPAARAEQAPVTDKAVWDALDRGEDPTAEAHG